MTTKTRNRIIALFIMAFPFMVLFGFLASQTIGPLPPVQPLPNPNGYDYFAKAGEMVATNSWNYDKMNLEQLRETTAANAEALALARAGLSNECRVPVQFSQAYAENHLSDLVGIKSLAQAFVTEGRLAEKESRYSDAAKSYLDAIHFGNESARGGVLIDQMVGTAVESIGTSHLTNLVDRLDAKSCRETTATLETLDEQQPTWDEVAQQEHDWSRRTFNSLRDKIFWPLLMRMTIPAYQRAKEKFQQQQIKMLRLLIDLAAHAYELDTGKPPASLANLVPDYLKAIPQDPFTGTNIVYSPR